MISVAEKPKGENSNEARFEVLRTPEISVCEERGAQLLSCILKAKNPKWGKSAGPFAEEAESYFQKNPLSPEISEFLDEIRALEEGGVDEETLYTIALTYGRPERNEAAFDFLTKQKSYSGDPQELQQKLLRVLGVFERSFSSSSLAEKLTHEVEADIEARQQNSKETGMRIEAQIAFFKPDSTTTEINKISLMPTDPLYRKDAGSSFVFGEELVLKTNIENPDNLDHEFLHSVINPIVGKLFQRLTEKQKESITHFASEKLKRDYGENPDSLLSEELIRTYNDVVKKGEQPKTYENFSQNVRDINEEQFQKLLSQSEILQARCGELKIATVTDFRDKSQEYFRRFEMNQLRDLIFELYQEYQNRIDKETDNFERFILKRFINKI